jgi:sugar phosphate isomerase/epimerase
MRVCISQATTMPAPFADDVEACAAAGCDALEIWLTKLEQHLERHSIAQTKQFMADRGVEAVAAAYQGGLLLAQGEARKAHYEQFRRRLELCQSLKIGTLLVAADFATRVAEEELERAVVSLKQAAQWAAGFDVRLALEFRAAQAFCSNLDTAVRLIETCAEPNVSINLDLFHFWTGPSKMEDIDLLAPQHIGFVQICDLAGSPRELATDSDRILPGDGDLPLTAILTKLKQRGFDGSVSLELMNPAIWQLKPSQVMELGAAAVRRVLPSSNC